MKRSDIKEFHFITYISNVPLILESGILARNVMKRKNFGFDDIAEQGVLDRRADKKIPGTSPSLQVTPKFYSKNCATDCVVARCDC